jgi:predicted DNA-binding ribbon-helix-helix protein
MALREDFEVEKSRYDRNMLLATRCGGSTVAQPLCQRVRQQLRLRIGDDLQASRPDFMAHRPRAGRMCRQFFEPVPPPLRRKRRAIASKRWPNFIWQYTRRGTRRSSAGANGDKLRIDLYLERVCVAILRNMARHHKCSLTRLIENLARDAEHALKYEPMTRAETEGLRASRLRSRRRHCAALTGRDRRTAAARRSSPLTRDLCRADRVGLCLLVFDPTLGGTCGYPDPPPQLSPANIV